MTLPRAFNAFVAAVYDRRIPFRGAHAPSRVLLGALAEQPPNPLPHLKLKFLQT